MTSLLSGPTTAAVTPALRRGRRAVFVTFAVAGALFAAWVPRIPEIKDRLDLVPSALGIALLGPAVGSLLAMSFVGRLTAHIGTAAATRGFGWFFCAVGWLSGLATSLPMLCGLLLLWGIGIGGMDVSMNAQAVSVEKAYRRPLMSGFHAAWSLGSLFGAGVGTLGAVFAVPVVGQQGAFAGVLAVAVGWASRSTSPTRSPIRNRTRARPIRPRRPSTPVAEALATRSTSG